MDKIKLYPRLETEIAHSDDVQGVLGDLALEITGRARANLARHRKHGEHRITQTKGRVDHFVNLVGPAALSIENGHFTNPGHLSLEFHFVEGLHILKDAIL